MRSRSERNTLAPGLGVMLLNKLAVHTEGLVTKRKMGVFKQAVKVASNHMSMLATTIIDMVNRKTWQPTFTTLNAGQLPITVSRKNLYFEIKVMAPMLRSLLAVEAAIDLYCRLRSEFVSTKGTRFSLFHAQSIA